jgi:hypothetical protein
MALAAKIAASGLRFHLCLGVKYDAFESIKKVRDKEIGPSQSREDRKDGATAMKHAFHLRVAGGLSEQKHSLAILAPWREQKKES